MRNPNMPLSGVKVVELSTYVAAPSCGRLLRYLGADVIKLESPSGEPYRRYGTIYYIPTKDEAPLFDVLNAGKRSVCVNLKNPSVREYVYKLLAGSDVFLTNVRNDALLRMQMDHEKLHQVNPSLIYAHFSGYGEKGALADNPGYDATAYFTRQGIYRDFVPPDGQPSTHMMGVGDQTSGLAMALSISAALYRRAVSGQGEYITAALNQTAIWTLLMPMLYEQYGSHFQRHTGDPLLPYETNYRCADGVWVIISATNDAQWERLCKCLGRAELLDMPAYETWQGRIERGRELYRIFADVIEKKTSEEFVALMQEYDIPVEVHRHVADIPKDPQLWENGFIYEDRYPKKKVVLPWPPFTFHRMDTVRETRGDSLGGHTLEVLRDLGCPENMLAELERAGEIISNAKDP